jgi:phytanoyl-CoA hydroxylase
MDIEKIKQDFNQDGYLFLPGFLDLHEVNIISEKLEKLIQNLLPHISPQQVKYEDKNDPSTLKLLQDLNEYDRYFSDILFESKFRELAKSLLGEEVIGKTVEYFNKPAKTGKATPPHQDGYYFMLNPVSAVTMWMALEEVDEENGWVSYVRGSHLHGMRPHSKTNTVGFSQGITDFGLDEDLKNEIFFPAKPGDLLIHHALTIHKAGQNTSENRSRKALGLIYFGASAKEDINAKEAYVKELNKSE